MKYKDTGFRAFYRHFIAVPMKENLKVALKDFPGAEDANCILTYGYIDREAGLTLEILAAGKETKKGFSFAEGNDTFSSKIRIGNVIDDEVAFFDDEDGSLAARYSGKLEMLHGYDAPEEVEKTRSMAFLDASRDENCIDDILVYLIKDDLGIGPMQDTLFNDIEFTEEFATWAKHLIEQKPLIILDAEKIRESNPKEYEAYQRLAARSIMGVPFGQHPLGFMVIRNMKQYTDRPEPLQLACFVAMMMLEQIRRTRMEKLTKMHDEDDGRFCIRYNILGPHNFVIDGKEIYEQDLPHPNRRAWIIMLYMVLHKRPVDQQKLIEDNWPDEEVDTARNNMRQAIFRLHNDLAAYHDVKVIDTRSRMMDFSCEVNVTTDADEMEDLYNRAKNLPDGDDKIILLKKAFELYRGRLFIQGEDGIGTWLYTYTTHYNQVYVDLTSALLTTLGHIKDYRCIMDYGPRALEIEPGILTAYYWIIIAADETGNSTAREKFFQKAAEDLIDEENEKLKKLLALQNHMS